MTNTERFNLCKQVCVDDISSAESPYIDWAHYEWGNEGELEELKIVISLSEDELGLSTTAAMVSKDGDYSSVPESLISKVENKINEFRAKIVAEIEKVIGTGVITIHDRIGDC